MTLEIVLIVTAVLLFGVIFEALRRRRLSEGFALFWILVGFAALLLAIGRPVVDALSDALASLMSNDALRQQMGRNAVLAMKRYRPELCFVRWEAVLREVAGQ